MKRSKNIICIQTQVNPYYHDPTKKLSKDSAIQSKIKHKKQFGTYFRSNKIHTTHFQTQHVSKKQVQMRRHVYQASQTHVLSLCKKKILTEHHCLSNAL